jgi:hypothetical protein
MLELLLVIGCASLESFRCYDRDKMDRQITKKVKLGTIVGLMLRLLTGSGGWFMPSQLGKIFGVTQ